MIRKRVYIACPLSGGNQLANIRQADDAFFALLQAGYAPFNPAWSMFAGGSFRNAGYVMAAATPFPRGTTHDDWMAVDLPWVAASHAVLRLPGESVGADREVQHAMLNGIPVFHSTESLVKDLPC